jgi:creatinine amidohydrolase
MSTTERPTGGAHYGDNEESEMVTWENTFKEIEDAKPEMAILPIGAIEQHSTHLPIGTDFMMAGYVARRVASELDAFLLPAVPYGNSQEHQDFMGTIWLQPSTLAQVVKDICRALKHHGFRKIVILNGHGGNWTLKPTMREINLDDPEMMVIMSGPSTIGANPVGQMTELHSGEIETSRFMAAFPELVKGRGKDFQPQVGREYLDYVGMRAVTPTGVWGQPSKASAEKGKVIADEAVRVIVAYVRDTFQRLEELRKKRKRK